MPEPLRLLMAEDSPDDAGLLEVALRAGGFDPEIHCVSTEEEFRAALAEGGWDAVLLDYSLPRFGALRGLEVLRETGSPLRALVISGTVGEDELVAAMRAGAVDYIQKENLSRLPPAIRRELKDAAARREYVSERKEAEAALRRSEAHFRSLIENASELIVVADTANGITYVSPSVERVLGYVAEERLGRSPLELVHPDDQMRVQQLFADTVRPVAVMEPLRVRLRHRDGSWRTLEAVARRQTGEGVVGGIVINARDITEREHLEAQLLQAQKIEAVGRLAGGIAHDFNNLVTAILGYADLALRRLAPQDPLRRNVEEITRAAERAAGLTQQLLAFSRKQVLQPRVLDVRAVLEGAQGLLRRLIGEDIELVIRAGPNVGRVRVDPVQLEQVLLNLAINARDAMPQGGRLVLEASDADLDEAYARDHLGGRAGRFVMIAVSDTGHGMDRETQARIFEPFFTTKEVGKGTGLGLSTVYGIVKQSGGYIWVYSEPGRGSTFKVYLPRVIPEGEESAPSPVEPAFPARGSETVLLVEDEDSVRELVQELLESVGYQVLTAARPAEAMRLSQDYAGRVHLLVTDVVMPQMGGPELAQRLRALRPEMKVLFLSGYSPGIVEEHGVLDHGATFLQKPFSAEALETKVRETLDGP
jgi:PAS domain S-box-containing protein